MDMIFRLMQKFIITSLLTVASLAGFAAQQEIIDSLKNALTTSGQDTSRVSLLLRLSKEYKNIQLDSADAYALEAIRISREKNHTRGIAAAYMLMGDIEVSRDNTEKAINHYLESIRYYNSGGFENELPKVYMVMGTLHTIKGENIEGLEYFLKSLEISRKYKMRLMEAQAQNNLGSVYKNLGKFDDALVSFNQALEICTELGITDQLHYIYGNLGILYATVGNKELAESYFIKLLQMARDNNDKVSEALALLTLGDFNNDVGRYNDALGYYNKSLDMSDVIIAKYSGPKSLFFANVYSGIGTSYFYLKSYDSAIEYLEKAYTTAQETNQLSVVSQISEKLSLAYEYKRNTASALKYARIHQFAKDSLQNMDNVRRITEMDMQNKFDKLMAEKEFEQALKDAVQKRNTFYYMMVIGGSVLGLVIFLLLFMLQKNKMKRVSLESENLQLEKENLHTALDYKNKELTTNVMYLLKKNELIHLVTDKLKKAKMSFKTENRVLIEEVIKDLEAASKGDIWKEFELRFNEVHSDFYKKLNEMFPNLSPNELKLCAFLRLNMSSKDIAAITFLSVNSINIARHRLRKKLNIDQEENLIMFLLSI